MKVSEKAKEQNRRTGIDVVGDVRWGTHLCQFYQSKEDLIDILVPYFKTGLENNEFCMWVSSKPLEAEEAKASLKKQVKDLDNYIKKGQIEILDYSDWYTKSGKFESNKVLQGWAKKEKDALKRGFDGLRLSGNTFWLEKKDWKNFTEYEREVNNVINEYQIMAICTYSLDRCNAFEIIDVVSNHQCALIKRKGKWKIIESGERERKELQKSEVKYRTLVEHLPAITYIAALDEASTTLYISPQVEKFIGVTAEEYVADPDLWREQLHPDDRDRVIKKVTKAHDTGNDFISEYRMISRSGNIIWFRDEATIAYDNYGHPVFLQGVMYNITERKKTEEDLQTQKLAIEQKNLALGEIIAQVELEKNKIKDDIATNVKEVLLPILEKLKIKKSPYKYVVLLKRHLEEITSSFGRKIAAKSTKLTSREIEICNMIKGGLTSKEISNLLNISSQTVEKHRKNIRNKLGITNKRANLSSYLHKL